MIVNRRPLASEGVRLQFKADEAGMGLLREAASSNKALHRTAITLRSIAAGELGR